MAAVLPLFKHQVEQPLDRPKTRGECEGGPRPCPFVGCRHHNYLEVKGKLIRLNHPDKEPEDLDPAASCSLDVADRGEHVMDDIAPVLGVSHEYIRQIESKGLRAAARLTEKVDGEVKFRKQCKAVDAFTGRRCGLLEHDDRTSHRSARGEFRVVAAAGQTRFEHQERLEREARRNPEDLEPNNV